jgi:hypothetical protein
MHAFYNIWYVFTTWFKTMGGIYILWIGIHYTASHLYIEFCVPKTLWGLIVSPFLTSTTHCSALRWAIQNGANEIQSMWLLLGTWISIRLLFHNSKTHTPFEKISQVEVE